MAFKEYGISMQTSNLIDFVCIVDVEIKVFLVEFELGNLGKSYRYSKGQSTLLENVWNKQQIQIKHAKQDLQSQIQSAMKPLCKSLAKGFKLNTYWETTQFFTLLFIILSVFALYIVY